MRRKLIALAAVLAIAGAAGITLYVFSRPMIFGKNPNPIRIPKDIAITKISIKVNGFKVGGSADYCLAMWRSEAPIYPVKAPTLGRGGFVEPLCFNTVRSKAVDGWVYPTGPQDGPVLVPAGDWEQEVDLSDTPIFVPEGTTFICNSLGTISSIYPAESMNGTCKVEYKTYRKGEPKYRFLRLPYYDQMFSADEPLVTSFYQNYTGGRALEIPSAVAYIGNNSHDSHMVACLTKSKNGETVDTFCFPEAKQDSPGQVRVGWTVNEGERLGLDCHYPPDDKTSSGDCAIFLVAKLPDGLSHSAENAFRDYGELPRDYVGKWCSQTATILKTERIDNPMLCLGKPGDVCTFEKKMENCIDSFESRAHPKASCMKDSSCYSAKND